MRMSTLKESMVVSSTKAGNDVIANMGLIINPHKLGHDAQILCNPWGKLGLLYSKGH